MIPALDPAVAKALRVCAEELDRLDADWAVAGATAMQAHGFSRATRDVDLFIGDDARVGLLARLRERGLPVTAIFAPHHYRLAPVGRRDAEASIDLLFPALGVESLGILAARRMPVAGVAMPVVPLPHLVALKLGSDPEIDPARHARDQADLLALRDRGLIDVGRVLEVLDDVGDSGARARLGRLGAAPTAPRRRSPRRPQKGAPRKSRS